MHEQMHVHAGWSFDYSFIFPVCPASQEMDERTVYLAPAPHSCPEVAPMGCPVNRSALPGSFARSFVNKGEFHVQNLVRTGVVVAGLVAAVTLTGCGSDSGKSDSGKGAADGQASATGGSDSGDSGDSGSAADASALEGTWAGMTDGKAVALSVASGKAALVADAHVCSGEVKDMGKVMLELKCTDGNTDRTMGSIESNNGKTITVSWDAGGKDTLAKTDPGALPTGLPGLPTP